MNADILKEWDEIVLMDCVSIYGLEELSKYMNLSEELVIAIRSIFDMLRRVKNNKFYNKKEIESVYLLIKDNISIVNDILIICENKITVYVYEVILGIFTDLIKLAEDNEMYEWSGNLLNVRDYWFNYYNIKIMNEESESENGSKKNKKR